MKSLKFLVGAIMAFGLVTLANAATINGAGSTWVYPLIGKWAAKYAQENGSQINYQAIGSGGGIRQIESGTVDFGASDMPLTSEELRKNNLIQFPTAIAGADMVVNVPGIAPGQLALSGPVIADIYMGKITKWNDPAIQRLNPDLNLPSLAIVVVHRSDGSGTTFTFANYLSKVSPEWNSKIGFNTSINWPTGVGGKGNAGVAAYVQNIKGSIGYVEYAYILENHLTYVKMFNQAGKLVSPSLEGFQAAAANVDFTKAKDFYVILTDQPGDASWPISGCTWEILKVNGTNNPAVVDFFMWGFEKGKDEARSIAFGPLPASTILAIRVYLKENLHIN